MSDRKWPYGNAYVWKGDEIGVLNGLGNVFIVGRQGAGGGHRVKSKFLPVCSSPEDAQQYLEKFAAKNGLVMAGKE